MNRYYTIVIYLYELKTYRDTCFTEIKPSDKYKINQEIDRIKTWLREYDSSKEKENRDPSHGFCVDKRTNVNVLRRLKKVSQELAL